MLNIGPQELIIILIIALVVVGPQRLPELGRTIGKALREFRKIQDDVKDMVKFDLDAIRTPTPGARRRIDRRAVRTAARDDDGDGRPTSDSRRAGPRDTTPTGPVTGGRTATSTAIPPSREPPE